MKIETRKNLTVHIGTPANPGDRYLAVSGRSGSGKIATAKMAISWLQSNVLEWLQLPGTSISLYRMCWRREDSNH